MHSFRAELIGKWNCVMLTKLDTTADKENRGNVNSMEM